MNPDLAGKTGKKAGFRGIFSTMLKFSNLNDIQMGRILLIITCLLIFCFSLQAQTEQITVKAGDDVATGFSPNGFFKYPQYMDGSFVLKDGSKATGRFNYNLVSGQMHFIGNNGDTLVLGEPVNIETIMVGNNPFIYDKGYIEILDHNDLISLGKKIIVKWQTESIGAYGMANPTGSVDHYRQIFAGNSYQRLNINQNIVFTKRTSFWLIDKNKNVIQANKKNFLKLYAADTQRAIEEYIKKNDIDFDKETELMQLIKQFPS